MHRDNGRVLALIYTFFYPLNFIYFFFFGDNNMSVSVSISNA